MPCLLQDWLPQHSGIKRWGQGSARGWLVLQAATSCCQLLISSLLCPVAESENTSGCIWAKPCSKQRAGCLVQLRSGGLAAKGRSLHGTGGGAKEAHKVCLAETAPALVWLAGERSSTLVMDEESTCLQGLRLAGSCGFPKQPDTT